MVMEILMGCMVCLLAIIAGILGTKDFTVVIEPPRKAGEPAEKPKKKETEKSKVSINDKREEAAKKRTSKPKSNYGEEWKKINDPINKGIKDIYLVSNQGRVYNTESGCYVGTPFMANLKCENGKLAQRKPAALVLSAFLGTPNPYGAYMPIHIDGDETNNCAYNLVWGKKLASHRER